MVDAAGLKGRSPFFATLTPGLKPGASKNSPVLPPGEDGEMNSPLQGEPAVRKQRERVRDDSRDGEVNSPLQGEFGKS